MKKSFPVFGFALAILVFLSLLLLLYVPPLKSHWVREANGLLAQAASHAAPAPTNQKAAGPITEADLERLPEPMRRYLRHVGVVGTLPVKAVHMKLRGNFKMATNRDFMPVTVEQVDTLEPPARSFYIHGKPWPLVSISGIDSYMAGEGRMRMKLFSRIPLFETKGAEMTESALVTLLNDFVLFPQAFLSTNLRYKAVDATTVEVTYSAHGRSVDAVLGINARGELTNFSSTNRWRLDGKSAVRETWSTPFSRYTNFGGILLPGRGEAWHHYEDVGHCYAIFGLPEYIRREPARVDDAPVR